MRIFHGLLLWSIVVVFIALADFKRLHPDQLAWLRADQSLHLGAEYNEIALAIRHGRGFADPFRQPTGPTAWMPPVLPYFQAVIYVLSGDNRAVVIYFMQGVSGLAILVTGLIVVTQARKMRLAWLGYAVFIIAVSANFYELFQKTHDSGLLLLVVSGLYLGSVRLWDRSCGGVQWSRCDFAWGAFGGFGALCSPVLGAAWLFITASNWWPRRQRPAIGFSKDGLGPQDQDGHTTSDVEHHAALEDDGGVSRPKPEASISHGVWPPIQPLLVAAIVSMVVVTPWTVRNWLVLGKWIPIKSNGMYELWQSHCVDDDGVLDTRTLGLHPYASGGEQRQKYAEVGEVVFINEKGREVRAAIANDPMDFFQRVANRWLAACAYYQPPYLELQTTLGNGWPVFLKRLVFPLPFLGLLVILWRAPVPMPAPITAAIAVYALVLLPYVLVSYYDRYAAPLVGMKMLIVLHALGLLFGRSIKSQSARTDCNQCS